MHEIFCTGQNIFSLGILEIKMNLELALGSYRNGVDKQESYSVFLPIVNVKSWQNRYILFTLNIEICIIWIFASCARLAFLSVLRNCENSFLECWTLKPNYSSPPFFMHLKLTQEFRACKQYSTGFLRDYLIKGKKIHCIMQTSF